MRSIGSEQGDVYIRGLMQAGPGPRSLLSLFDLKVLTRPNKYFTYVKIKWIKIPLE